MVAQRKQCSYRPTVTPKAACSASLYRRIKRRVGRSLKRVHCQRNLVTTRKQTAYKLLRTKSSPSGSKRVSRNMHGKNGSDSDRQHYSSSLHQQGRRHEVGPTLCPTLENLDLVLREASDSEGPTHSRPPKCSGRQTVQIGTDYSNRMVPPSRGFSSLVQQVAPASNRSLCYEIQQKGAPVRISSSGPHGHCSGCTQFVMGGSGRIRLPTDRHIGQSGGKVAGLSIPEADHHCPGVAQHDMVLGPSGNVQPDSTALASITKPTDRTLQSDPSQESDKSKSPCMAPRATAIKEQGFSEAVATRIEAPQRGSTRSVYEAKWAVFTKWCITNQVNFRVPPVKSVADFLMYLFEDRKLQPSTIDGYRSAIADKLGNTTLNISKDENLTRLLDSFHRDRPKGRRGIPSWNLSLVLHQLTKAPFEPIKEASLKHLTFKTVFLLALGSGKCRSEIHAWQRKNIRHQSDWSKVSLYPSPSFLSKNQLAKEGPDSVAPVVIPALAPTLDRSLKSDRSLCPVRALRYYLDRTSDIRQNKELVFASFKKGFDKDISPATISSWIKQTVILCYELSDQEAHTLHQVKAHDVRAFAASKAFQSGVSLEQITKAPFEPIKEASLKHLTFKTVFLLALGSGKRRSEIHAWQRKNIRHQSDWSKVSLYPSPSFLSKNQLAKEGPDSVAPVVIPALAPTLDRSLKSDRSLCPVRALRYYLDRTSDIRQNKELVFASFKKGFDKDISPATISSWIKQTVILCYELSDQEAHTLHQVKAHDVRAFAASKAFQSGEQILSACHWKSHNTFTQFYLKDVAWADSELYHLGPVVAAQQIHK